MKTLIFGCSGIGGGIARRLVGEGKRVHLAGRNVAALAEELGASASFSVCDVTVPGNIEKAAQEAGEIEGLAYCVGTIVLKRLKDVKREDLLKDLMIHSVGAALAVQASSNALKASNGSVVLFSTVAAQTGMVNHTSVAMAKGAVESLTRTLAAELSPSIRVNCIAPSLIRTPLSSSITSKDAIVAAIAASHPLQRIGAIDDVVPLACLLLSKESSWITGQIIGVDGGKSVVSK